MNPKNSRELKRTQGNSRELKATWDSSREALVEVRKEKIHKGKKNSGKLEKNSGNGRKKLRKWHEYSIGKNSQI